ncbi:MAG: DUF4178 domain-containing protein [Chitinophagaceae bacterium]|nr:DUF4178 domain-containing protein [Chitinophagaceae bacterium]
MAHSCSFTELGFSNLRSKFDAGKTFHCDHCSCDTALPLFPYVQSWTCGQCNRAYAYFNGAAREDGAISRQKAELRFNINSIVSLKGVDYVLTGHMLKKDAQEGFVWNEYVLYNKEEGFAFLNESEGHWLLVKELGHPLPKSCALVREFEYDGRSFRLFNNYGFRITHAQGSFPGNVFNDSYQLYTREFIAPPYLISVEEGKAEYITWFIGSSVSRKELENQAEGYLPTPMGVGPAELKSSSDKTLIIRTAFGAVLLLFLAHIFAGYTMRERVLLYNTYTMGDSVANQSFVTEPFELTKWKSNLEFVIEAPVDNSWFELEATLVNKVSGDEYSLQQGVEHYQGYEDGERWVEGSTTETAYMNSIPAGTYFFRFNGIRDPYSFNFSGSRLDQFSVKVTNDVPSHRNLILLLLLIAVWPVYKIIMINYYEKSRWENSPYNPYPVNY